MKTITRSFRSLVIPLLLVACAGTATQQQSNRYSMPPRAVMECMTPNDIAENSVKLPRGIEQGQLVIGYAVPGSRVGYNDHELSVSNNGAFKFHVPRDAPFVLQLQVTPPGGTEGVVVRPVTQSRNPNERTNALPKSAVTLSQLANGTNSCGS
ncbi:MAG: hypothetical protein M3R20_03805 [Pseudomonadota bacterium]|nr:hypothetical protein [Pseudomonadota bacterium]